MSISLLQDKSPSELTNMELAEEWENIHHIEEQIKEVKAIIRDESLHRMEKQNVDFLSAGEWIIKKQTRVTTTNANIPSARALKATKIRLELDPMVFDRMKEQPFTLLLKNTNMSEVIDNRMIKKILDRGDNVEGVKQTVFIKVERIEANE